MYRIGTLLLAFAAAQVTGQTGSAIIQPNPNSPCTVCWSSSETPTTTPSFVWFTGQTNLTCASIIADVDKNNTLQGSDTCKNNQLAAFQLGCCKSPPYDYCPVCANNGTYSPNNVIPLGSTQQYTCAENLYRVASYNALVQPGNCSDTVIERGSFYCGCPNAQQQCWLCPDQSPVGNPARGDAWVTNSNCQGLEFLFSLYNKQECTNLMTDFGVDYANFCKCPGQQQTAISQECLLCSGGLANPDFTYTSSSDTYQRTCSQAADFAKSIIRQNICDKYMGEVLAKGCKCNSGGPVFQNKNSGAMGMTTALSAAATIALVLKGVLA